MPQFDYRGRVKPFLKSPNSKKSQPPLFFIGKLPLFGLVGSTPAPPPVPFHRKFHLILNFVCFCEEGEGMGVSKSMNIDKLILMNSLKLINLLYIFLFGPI